MRICPQDMCTAQPTMNMERRRRTTRLRTSMGNPRNTNTNTWPRQQ